MLFNSLEFLILFLPVTFIGFFLLASIRPWGGWLAATWLSAASIFFYGWWDPRNVLLLCGSIVFNYLLGRAQVRRTERSIGLLWLAVGGNLCLLGTYKYLGFVTTSINALARTALPVPDIALPLGISFFTFTQIAFQVDVYRSLVREYNFIHYTLFVTYFPHLIAGPILHHKQMMPQFARPETYRVSAESIAVGMSIFTAGLAKKVLLADRLGAFATPVFLSAVGGDAPTLFVAWTGALAFAFQIYFDFSGYSDMAIGLSRLFGIDLPLNFNSPYKARSIIEFWRRWHMSLSIFLKDYLYIPLGGNRLGTLRRYENLMATMLLGGLWHGANWTFVVWGGMHGLYLCANHAWKALRGHAAPQPGRLGRMLGTATTFLAVVVAWVFFKAESFTGALGMLRGMAGQGGVSLPMRVQGLFGGLQLAEIRFEGLFADNEALMALGAGRFMVLLLLTGAICWGLPNSQEMFLRAGRPDAARGPTWRACRVWAVGLGTLLAACVMDMQHVSEFLYFQF
jgi:alginate O-acetyltransferase complex protein AlgI